MLVVCATMHALTPFILIATSIALAVPPQGADATETALLKTIVGEPDEDTPRLVYADWLDEHNRPERAELIRLQVGIANRQIKEPWRVRRAFELEARVHATELPKELKRPFAQVRYVRGFPEDVAVYVARSDLAHVLDRVPFIRRLTLAGPNAPDEICVGDLSMDVLTWKPYQDQTRNLVSLVLVGARVSDGVFSCVLPYLDKLRELSATLACFYRNSLIQLIRSALGPRLRRLDLAGDWGMWDDVAAGGPPEGALRQAFEELGDREPALELVAANLYFLLPLSMRQSQKVGVVADQVSECAAAIARMFPQ